MLHLGSIFGATSLTFIEQKALELEFSVPSVGFWL